MAEFIDKGCPMVLGGPLSNVMAAKAVAFKEARQPEFKTYAQQVADNAVALADGIARRGGRIVTGGTENHLVLVDVQPFGLTGRQAESALEDAGVHRQPQLDPERHQRRLVHVRHPGSAPLR